MCVRMTMVTWVSVRVVTCWLQGAMQLYMIWDKHRIEQDRIQNPGTHTHCMQPVRTCRQAPLLV